MGSSTSCCSQERDVNDAAGDAPASAVLLTPTELAAKSKEAITDKEIDLAQSTWKKAAGLGAETVGVILFKHIFTIAPGALELFPFKKEPNVKSFETPGLKKHASGVVLTVGTAVDGLKNLGAVAPVLAELAIRHVGYNVEPAHYEVVGKALMLTLRDGLGAAFTEPVQVAWAKVWAIVASTMLKAARPLYDSKQKEAAKATPEKKAEGPLGPEDIALVQKSWAKAEALGMEAVGVELFKHIFQAAPEAVQLFSFKGDWKNLYESPRLKSHATKVASTVGTAVGMLNNLDGLVPVLKELGTKHVGYQVVKPHYDVVGNALIDTLSDALGKDFTPEVKAAWLKVYGVVASTMMDKHY